MFRLHWSSNRELSTSHLSSQQTEPAVPKQHMYHIIFGLCHWGSLGVPAQTAVPVSHVRIQSSLESLLTGSKVEYMMHVTHHSFALKS